MSRHGTLIRAVTWNIHGCVGRRGRFDPDAIAVLLRELNPDILALQEVDSRTARSVGLDTFAYLAETLGLFALHARTIRTPSGDYGHMLMSRWHFFDGDEHDLSVGNREPRHAITGEIRTFERPLWILAAHLGLRAAERRIQVDRIRRLADHCGNGPAIILGDFNEWRYPGVAGRSLCPPFHPVERLLSYPSVRPLFPLDRIWYRGPLSLRRAWIVGAGRLHSDHLPLAAEWQMGAGRQPFEVSA